MVDTSNYARKNYWEDRFEKTDGYFDWYVGWRELQAIVKNLISKESKILMVGCGNSKLSENMYSEDYFNITNIDISGIVIKKMNEEKDNKNMEKMIYLEMDATSMTFEDNSFDFVLDKGTLDALTCGSEMDIPERLIREMHRVTKVGGNYCVITHSGPHCRLPFFMSSLDKGTYELSYKKVELSMMSNLINSIKSHKKNKNVTMKDALKDKNILIDSLIDVFNQKSLASKLNQEVLTDKEKKMQSVSKYLKIMKLLSEKKEAKTKKEEKLSEDSKIEDNTNTGEVVEKVNEKSENLKNANDEVNDESTGFEKEKNDNFSVENKSSHTDIRRDHCHCFIFTKVC